MRATRRARKTARSRGAAPPALVLEAIERFVRVLARTGVPARELARAFRDACDRVPATLVREGRHEVRKTIDALHVVTLWFSDPDFLDAEGRPLALTAEGRGPSIASLIRRIDASLDPSEAIEYLLKVNALRRKGARYVPKRREARMRGTGALVHARNLDPILGILRTLEHNSRPRHEARSWFERIAQNPCVPVRALAQFDARFERVATDFTRSMDALMHRAERARRGNEPTVRLGIGVYRFEGESPTKAAPPGARRRRQRRSPKAPARNRRS